MGQIEAEDEVERIMKLVDKNNSGAIDYTGNYFFNILNMKFLFYRIRNGYN